MSISSDLLYSSVAQCACRVLQPVSQYFQDTCALNYNTLNYVCTLKTRMCVSYAYDTPLNRRALGIMQTLHTSNHRLCLDSLLYSVFD